MIYKHTWDHGISACIILITMTQSTIQQHLLQMCSVKKRKVQFQTKSYMCGLMTAGTVHP